MPISPNISPHSDSAPKLLRPRISNPVRHPSGPEHRMPTSLPGLELYETLGPDLVQDAEAALPTPNGVGRLDDVAGAAVTATVLDAAEGRNGDGGGSGGGGCWFGHAYCLFIEYAIVPWGKQTTSNNDLRRWWVSVMKFWASKQQLIQRTAARPICERFMAVGRLGS